MCSLLKNRIPIISTLDCMECTPSKVRIDFSISYSNELMFYQYHVFLSNAIPKCSKEISDLFEYKLYLHTHLVTFYQEKMAKG